MPKISFSPVRFWIVIALSLLLSVACREVIVDSVPQTEQQPAAEPTAAETQEELAPTAPPEAEQATENSLFIASIAEIESPDPAVGQDAGSKTVHLSAYEALVQYKLGTAELEPGLATEWEVSPDGKVYTFQLRPGVHFHSGNEFTAEAVQVSFDRVRDVGLGAAYLLTEYDHTEIIDDYTVAIHLKNPQAPFLRMLPGLFIVNPERVKEHADDLAQAWFGENTDGTGPYMLEKWDRGALEIVLVKNDNYWRGWEGPHLDRITKRVIPEISTQRLMLESGDADIIQLYTIDGALAMMENSELQIEFFPSQNAFVAVLANHKPPLSDVRVRQALAYAFDYDQFIENVYQGLADRMIGPLPSAIPLFDESLEPYNRDIERARQLLAEAGYEPDEITLELKVVEGIEPMINASQLLQANAAEIGININIQQVTWPALVGLFQDPEQAPDIFPLYQYPAYPDPDAIFSVNYHTSAQRTGGYNGGYFGNAETDALIEGGRTTVDEAERAELYSQLQQIILEDSVNIFLASPRQPFLARQWVKGFVFTPSWPNTWPFYNMSLEGKP